MGENRNFILSIVASLCFIIITGVLFIQNNILSKQISLGLQTLSINQQNDIVAINNKISSLEEKINTPVEEGAVVLYENINYGFRFVNSDKCDKGYILVKETENQFISVFAPGNKSWVQNTNNAAWVSYEIMSLDDYNKMELDEIYGKPEIVLTLKNNYLLVKGAIQDGPEVPVDCSWEIEKI